jgi:FkbM family methyltransferase
MWFSLATRTRFLRGSYERKLAEFFSGGIQPGEVFWDAGAHFGYYTLLAAKAGARVHAFEPHAANRAFLDAHVRWNRLAGRVKVHACALGESDGRVEFGAGRGSGSRTLGTGPRAVEVRSPDSLVAAGECEPPDWLKVDVQGSEEQVLAGGERVLRGASCAVACATHGPDLHERCTFRLEALGYRVLSGTARRVILAFGPGRAVPDVDVGLLGDERRSLGWTHAYSFCFRSPLRPPVAARRRAPIPSCSLRPFRDTYTRWTARPSTGPGSTSGSWRRARSPRPMPRAASRLPECPPAA